MKFRVEKRIVCQKGMSKKKLYLWDKINFSIKTIILFQKEISSLTFNL